MEQCWLFLPEELVIGKRLMEANVTCLLPEKRIALNEGTYDRSSFQVLQHPSHSPDAQQSAHNCNGHSIPQSCDYYL